MKFGIDTFGSGHGHSGTGSYLHYFVAHIASTEGIAFELFGSDMDRYTYTASASTPIPFRAIRVADNERSEGLWHRFRAKHFISSHGYDAVLYPSARCLPASFKTPGVAVVNAILIDSEDAENDTLVKRLSMATKIIASSKVVRRSLVQHGIDDNKIDVIHNGIDHTLFYPQLSSSNDNLNIKPFAIARPYFVYASRLSGSDKHHIELIRAFTLFKARTHLPHRLVLAGDSGAYSERVQQEVLCSPVNSQIFLTGFFPHDSLPMLYACADACAFPSANEGVGLPILEAMSCGVPVICSRSGALPEMAGRAALLFDSEDIEEIAACMEKTATDKSLRAEMIAEGLRWSKRFSWDYTVSQTTQVLQSVVASR